MTGSITRFARWWLRPIGWPMFTAVGMVAVWLLWLGLHPSLYYMADVFLLFYFWMAVGFAYLARTLIRRFVASTVDAPATPVASAWRREAMLFSIPLIVTLLIALRVPLRIGFLTARPGLTRLVETAQEGRMPQLSEDQRCGLYTISAMANRTCHIKGRIMFILADDAEAGFIYSPNGIDDLCYNSGSKGHLWANWYWMKED